MTLAEKYAQIMDRIELTEAMRRRVLENVRGAAAEKKPIRFPNRRRWVAVAACLALLLIGALALPKVAWGGSQEPSAETANGISACASAEELSRAVGFPVSDVTALPFAVTQTSYLNYWDQLAEIQYRGADGQSAVYRKSAGTEDNSGDYSEYPSTRELTAGSVTAELRGSGERYTLACWTDGTYAYSLSLPQGADAAAWTEILAGLK